VFLPESAPWLADYIDELTSFPRAPHDDQLDATTQALGWFRCQRHEYHGYVALPPRKDLDVGHGSGSSFKPKVCPHGYPTSIECGACYSEEDDLRTLSVIGWLAGDGCSGRGHGDGQIRTGNAAELIADFCRFWAPDLPRASILDLKSTSRISAQQSKSL
jgi:hypothetical protein